MSVIYQKALKIYNIDKNEWCNPKRGTPQHKEVLKIAEQFKKKKITTKEQKNNDIQKALSVIEASIRYNERVGSPMSVINSLNLQKKKIMDGDVNIRRRYLKK